MVVNAGYRASNGMPVGVEWITAQFNEPLLIAMAYAYEQNSPKRIAPKLILSQKSFESYSIAEMNNLFSILGQKTYDSFLKENNSRSLTPEIFHSIFTQTINNTSQ